ncbi:MAG: thiamine pyrophosphate-binding protein [Candidatus Thorarchaeota archaeon]
MKVSDYVVDFLFQVGIDHVFTVPGGGCIHLIDSLGKSPINVIPTLHEQGAAIAAEGYSQVAGLGALVVTTGPGGTNAITGVASAWLDSVPLIVIGGQVQLHDTIGYSGRRQNGFQELNNTALYAPITKYCIQVKDPHWIPEVMQTAYDKALEGRPGPVYIEIPLDVQAAQIGVKPDVFKYLTEPQTIDVCEVVKAFNKSSKPALLLGNGVRKCGKSMIQALISMLGIPTMVTWRALDLVPETNVNYVGRPGIIGDRFANKIQQEADFLLCIGARLDHGQTAYNPLNFAPKAKKFIVDIDPTELSKFKGTNSELICCDSEDFIGSLLEYEQSLALSKFGWANSILLTVDDFREGGYNMYSFINLLSELIQGNKYNIVPGSSGAASEITLQALRVRDGLRVFNSPGLGAMGFGIPASIGAAFANLQKTICIEGDGSFFMNIQELELIKRYNLDIKFFVINNNGYGSIRKTQKNHFSQKVACDPESGLTLPDIEKTVKAFGIENYLQIKGHLNGIKIKNFLETPGPGVCELIFDEEIEAIPRVISKKNADGSFSSMDMGEMYPYE